MLNYRVKFILFDILLNKPFGLALVVFIPLILFVYTLILTNSVNLPLNKVLESVSNLVSLAANKKAQSEILIETLPVESVFKPLLKPIYTLPASITVEGTSINQQVIPVGVADDGSMEVPASWSEAGWYEKSALPGDNGNLIINGHLDNSFGQPAAFWELKNVKSGDKVKVVDKLSRDYVYQVSEVIKVDINDPNRLSVLKNDTSKKELTLITCDGYWLSNKSTYNSRLVVKAELLDK